MFTLSQRLAWRKTCPESEFLGWKHQKPRDVLISFTQLYSAVTEFRERVNWAQLRGSQPWRNGGARNALMCAPCNVGVKNELHLETEYAWSELMKKSWEGAALNAGFIMLICYNKKIRRISKQRRGRFAISCSHSNFWDLWFTLSIKNQKQPFSCS